MKNNQDINDLKFPVSRQSFPVSRELSMDDYYEFVVTNLALFGKPPLEKNAKVQRFVIRDEETKFASGDSPQ